MTRTDWTRAEIAALFDLPFDELMYQAQTVHRTHHAPSEVQLAVVQDRPASTTPATPPAPAPPPPPAGPGSDTGQQEVSSLALRSPAFTYLAVSCCPWVRRRGSVGKLASTVELALLLRSCLPAAWRTWTSLLRFGNPRSPAASLPRRRRRAVTYPVDL